MRLGRNLRQRGPRNQKPSLQTQAMGILRLPGITAHLYLPNVGNYLLSDGSTGLTTVDGVTGLVLDGMGTLGPNLVTNGDFSGGSAGWYVAPGWTLVGGQLVGSAGSNPSAQDLTTASVIDKTYKIELDVIGSGDMYFAGSTVVNIAGPGRITCYAKANDIGAHIEFWPGGSGLTIDNISVREVIGIPARELTTAAKPILKFTSGKYWWDFDGVDDALTRTFAAGYESATVINAAPGGQVTLTGQNIVGAYPITTDTYGQIIVKESASLSAGQIAVLQAYANSLAGV